MIIRIESMGGFAGIAAAAAPPRRVEVPDGSDMAHAFAPEALDRIATGRGDCTDGISYRITVIRQGDERCFELPESRLPPELLDMIDRI
ncbi:hypothetical protein Q4511_10090 [Paracoccus sp. 1_MG-2023]|uniref:protealysin inhibitor emfourin n=1 Tax=unclassified Paracoccus (in: a-proteobacteria) TaxID=2688777 RepID=UPI001C087C1E|nr:MULTISPECIES: protealysin inhibitor emfourin [unclassified Paracoccus (in: a-proteobacteria)]MBU2958140.1 hypothetical protein [Paracoccus sp. C2R09]MDO6669274.1 hypothetical protein [Paracoccus sp. 1_MG-2023]